MDKSITISIMNNHILLKNETEICINIVQMYLNSNKYHFNYLTIQYLNNHRTVEKENGFQDNNFLITIQLS